MVGRLAWKFGRWSPHSRLSRFILSRCLMALLFSRSLSRSSVRLSGPPLTRGRVLPTRARELIRSARDNTPLAVTLLLVRCLAERRRTTKSWNHERLECESASTGRCFAPGVRVLRRWRTVWCRSTIIYTSTSLPTLIP